MLIVTYEVRKIVSESWIIVSPTPEAIVNLDTAAVSLDREPIYYYDNLVETFECLEAVYYPQGVSPSNPYFLYIYGSLEDRACNLGRTN